MTKRLFRFSLFVIVSNMLVVLYFMLVQGLTPYVQDTGIENGYLDASTVSFMGDKSTINLDGEWLCYPGTFASPSAIRSRGLTPQKVDLPSYFTDIEGVVDANTSVTYQLTVKTNGVPGVYGIRTHAIFTDYQLWINDEQVYSTADENGAFNEYYYDPQVIPFYISGTDEITITICVRNQKHPYGGISESLTFGNAEKLSQNQTHSLLITMLIFALCFITFLYNFFNFLVNRKDNRVLLFFALVCLFVGIRCLIRYEVILTMVFPKLPFEIGSSIYYAILPACLVTLLHFLNYFYRNCLPRWFFSMMAVGGTMNLLFVLTTSAKDYIPIYKDFVVFSCATLLVAMLVFTKALIKGYPGALAFACGSYTFILGALLDFATYYGIIKSRYTIAIGMSGYILMMASAIVHKNVSAQEEEVKLYYEQQEALDKARLIRNDFLSSQMKPHFLYNTLNNIAENCYSDPETAKKLIAALKEYMERTLKIDSRTNLVTIDQELDLVHAYTFIEETRFKGLVVEYDLPDPLPPIKIPMLSIQPLVENAIKHGVRRQPENGKVIVRIQPIENYVLFTVMDTGVGMDDEQISKLFRKPTGNKSIGMYNINYRLHELYNTGLNVTSAIGEGTCISFKIPY